MSSLLHRLMQQQRQDQEMPLLKDIILIRIRMVLMLGMALTTFRLVTDLTRAVNNPDMFNLKQASDTYLG
jgi:hypothetical protein